MTDTYHCPRFKSHSTRDRRFVWEHMSNGEVRAAVYCMKCEPMDFIGEIANPEMYADLMPGPKPPSLKPML